MQDLLSLISLTNIKAAYHKNVYEEGYKYFIEGAVKEFSINTISATQFFVQGMVLGDKLYKVLVKIENELKSLNIESTCACEAQKDCKHAVALLLRALNINKIEKKASRFSNNLVESLKKSVTDSLLVKANEDDHAIHYVIELSSNHECSLSIFLVKTLQNGRQVAVRSFDAENIKHRKHLKPIDNKVLNEINNLCSDLFIELLKTKRCHFTTVDAPVLSLGDLKKAKVLSYVDKENVKTSVFEVDGVRQYVFFLDKFWYFDRDLNTCGMLETENAFDDCWKEHLQNTIFPEVTLVPGLRLFEAQIIDSYQALPKRPLAELYFYYNDHKIPWQDKSIKFQWEEQGVTFVIERDLLQEAKYIQKLESLNLVLVQDALQGLTYIQSYAPMFLLDVNAEPLVFSQEILPILRQEGWHIELALEYSYQFIDYKEEDWYSEVESTDKLDWFSLDLGIIVDNEKINLLPVLVDLLKNVGDQDFNSLEQEFVVTKLPNGKFIKLRSQRLKKIVNILVELYDLENLNLDSKLQLSKLHAGRLLELEAAFNATKLRWFGGEKLRILGQKLLNFDKITTVEAPENLSAILRNYQQEGLNWLQFLREYEFGGILADDMGLGKTLQTLAHILLEKLSGRMATPSLVVAPTSLMFNWQLEAQKFTPQLKVLVLHGGNRKEHFDNLLDYDVILTTYPLLARDKDILLTLQFYFLILDEAQYIKNYKTKATQIALQLHAQYRLCLTGTPMENHLGELWSLFNFMMPGLLGSNKFFTKVFKNPIEKQGDLSRQEYLNKRIAPFLLRRTKNKVLQELPAKVEIIRYIELNEAQRDLYETLRLTLQDKLLQNIESLGLMRSKIIILDALLKLRQICCDPRLVKLESVKKQEIPSEKLTFLVNLIVELLAEGRKILIFSQFTEMLGLIESELHKVNIDYALLTGKTKDRQEPVNAFQNGEVSVFLVSLKAGGVGLNLTAADVVIHYDPWWNPAVENQATDRAHRIGQNNTVFVYKLITKGTVEEKMLALQQKKQKLLTELFAENMVNKVDLNANDLQILFEPLEY